MHESWKKRLAPLNKLAVQIYNKIALDKVVVFPPEAQRYAAFDMPFEDVKVVIIGQDPYYQPGVANGLAFSINKGLPLTVSLENIYKELYKDLGIRTPKHGDLSGWVKQGVLLLNDSLSVEAYKPASHSEYGWKKFTDEVIKMLSEEHSCLVFILWGAHAVSKVKDIDLSKHYVIKSTHPASRPPDRATKTLPAFFGNKPFSKCNDYLWDHCRGTIDWRIKE